MVNNITTRIDMKTTATQGMAGLNQNRVCIHESFIQLRAKGTCDVDTEEEEMPMHVSCLVVYLTTESKAVQPLI